MRNGHLNGSSNVINGGANHHHQYAPPPNSTTTTTNPRHPPPYEGPSSNGFVSSRLPTAAPSSGRSDPSSNGRTYYYSSGTPGSTTTPSSPSTAASTVSPTHRTQSYRTTTTTLKSAKDFKEERRNGMDYSSVKPRTNTLPTNSRRANYDDQLPTPPSYQVEHLASFAVGRQFGLLTPSDGVRKLKQMEKNSAIWAQPMVLKLFPDRVCVEDESGDLVEQFPMELVVDPTAHHSNDPADMFNNVLLFVVKEDSRSGKRNFVPTEMHIFQCVRTPSQEVAEDLHHYIKGQYQKVRPGFRESGFASNAPAPPPTQATFASTGPPPSRGQYRDDISAASNSTEYFEMDVNTLNRCFDDIERFVARIQSAAIAQRELEMQQHRLRSQRSSSKRSAREAAAAAQHGILQLRAQMPTYNEFFEIFQKFKLSFNLLAKLKNHIHEPNAPELLHFLFTPLTVILDACNWGLGMNVAEQVLNPLLSLDSCELLRNCLNSKEVDVWMALGNAWRTPPEDWLGALPLPYRPVFSDGFAPYGFPTTVEQAAAPPAAAPIYQAHAPQRYSSAPAPIHRGVSAPVSQQQNFYGAATRSAPYRERSVDNLNLERINLEKERLEFERMKVLDREQHLLEQERRLRQEEARLEAERRLLHKEAEKHSIAGSDRPDFYRRDISSVQHSPHLDRRHGSVQVLSNGHVSNHGNNYNSPRSAASVNVVVSPPIAVPDQSPRQKAFLQELAQRRCKIVQVTYDRVAQNPKELTVARGEYLEVLNDQKNWWECRNVHNRLGYVPHTILSVVGVDSVSTSLQDPQDRNVGNGQPSPRNGTAAAALNCVTNVSVRPDGSPQQISGLVDGINSIKLRPTQARDPNFIKSRLFVERQEEHKYVPEIVDTIKRNKQVIGPRRVASMRGLMINENSNQEQLQAWLRDKGFSNYVQSVFSECEAIDLFQLSKDGLTKYCGEEGNRLFSLLLVQKRRSNFASGTEAQLKALLEMRKKHVDTNNEGEIEPEVPLPSQPKKQKLESPLSVNELSASSTHTASPKPGLRCVREPSFFAQSVRSYL